VDTYTVLYLRKIQTITMILALAAGIFISIRYKDGAIDKTNAMLFTSIIVFTASAVELIISILTKQSTAKGILISKSNAPTIYFISVLTTFILCFIALIGIFAYWE